MKNTFKNISFILAVASLAACGGGEKSGTETTSDSTAVAVKTDSVKDIVLYNIPAPIETFTILKLAGPGFDKSLTNPAENISKYTSNYTKSVNLGIYSSDLAFCFLYKQNQEFNMYLKNINELTTALGIDGSYGQTVTTRLQANSNNMDSLMAIVSEASVNADLYLKENQRNSTTAMIAAGTWIEAMHIIASIADKKQNETISGLVADQKIAARNLTKMLEQFGSDADVSSLAKSVKEISDIYEGLQPVKGEALVSEDKMLKSIGNNTTYSLTKEQLKSILSKVETLRSTLIN
jgi:hypothetical protein